MQNLMGGYRLLNYIPADVLALALVVLCVAILIPGREYFEGGLGYNVCLSSQLGDIALIGIISTGVRILQHGCSLAVLNDPFWGFVCISTATLTAIVWQMLVIMSSGGKWGTVMDVYHNIFIVPLLVYFLLLTLPLVYCCGNLSQKLWVLFLLLSFVGFLIFDGKTKRLQQPEWLQKHGFGFILRK